MAHLYFSLVLGFSVLFLRCGSISLYDFDCHRAVGSCIKMHWISLDCVMYTFLFVNMTAPSFLFSSRTNSRVSLISRTHTAFILISLPVRSIPSRPGLVMLARWLVAVSIKYLLLWIMFSAGAGHLLEYAAESTIMLDLPLPLKWAS